MYSRVNLIKLSFVVLALMMVVPLKAHADEEVDVSSRGPVVSLAEGDVQVKMFGSSAWKAAEEGLILGPGDMVRTGSGSRIEITHYSGTTRLYENTILTVPSIVSRDGNRDLGKVILEKGAGLFRLDSERLKGEFKVRTRHIVAGVKGTTFAVKTDEKSSKVAVYDGKVKVREVGRSERESVGVEKGKSIEAVSEKGLGQVKKFKKQNDWKGWEEGRSPSLEVKVNTVIMKGRLKESSINGSSKNSDSTLTDTRSGSSTDETKDTSSTTNMDSDSGTNSISDRNDNTDADVKTSVDSISIGN